MSRTKTLLFAERFGIFAPRRNSFPPTGAPFGVFRTNGSVVEQFCNRCAHRFFQFYVNATFRAWLAVPRKRNFAWHLEQKVLKRGGPPPPPHAPLHTHPHTSIHARTPNPHTHSRPRRHTHTYGRIRRQAGGRRACPAGDLPHGGRPAWGLRRTRNVELAPETRHDRFNQVGNVKTGPGDVWKLQTVCAVPRNRYSDTQT